MKLDLRKIHENGSLVLILELFIVYRFIHIYGSIYLISYLCSKLLNTNG
jgi:hypothetical protein